jgi:hypothetical protein
MIKVVGAMLTALILLGAGFIVVPKLLLNAPGTNVSKNRQDVPLGELRAAPSGTAFAAQGSGTPLARRLEEFQSIQAGAGFAPLTPASLPTGYQEWQRYLRQGDLPAVVIAYRNPENRYLVIVENKLDPNAAAPRGVPGFGGGRGRADGTPAAGAQSPRVTIGDTFGTYRTGVFGPAFRTVSDMFGGVAPAGMMPHTLFFTRGDLEVTLVADQIDIPRDELVKIAASLR